MNSNTANPIVEIIGAENFTWLCEAFSRSTTLEDVPSAILEPVSRADATRRDLASDPNAITAIALITFAYGLAEKLQHPQTGSNDLMLAKLLARNELDRRSGRKHLDNPLWSRPLYELITGQVGDRIRSLRLMTTHTGEPGG
ncbi:MAG: hypothetical protein PVG49_11425 [Desulfobacteraceae bacterium]|jgi:hypothetical protein